MSAACERDVEGGVGRLTVLRSAALLRPVSQVASPRLHSSLMIGEEREGRGGLCSVLWLLRCCCYLLLCCCVVHFVGPTTLLQSSCSAGARSQHPAEQVLTRGC